jgi:hypothetical protein
MRENEADDWEKGIPMAAMVSAEWYFRRNFAPRQSGRDCHARNIPERRCRILGRINFEKSQQER